MPLLQHYPLQNLEEQDAEMMDTFHSEQGSSQRERWVAREGRKLQLMGQPMGFLQRDIQRLRLAYSLTATTL